MNEEKHIEVWNNFLSIVRNIIEPVQFNRWFGPIVPVSLVDSSLTVEVPSDFFREWLEDNYLDIIRKVLKRVIGGDAKLFYTIKPVANQPSITLKGQEATTPVNPNVSVPVYQPTNGSGAFVFPGITKVQINPRLNPAYSFGNFVEGPCNKLGISAGKSISNAPGKTPFNPLFIFGGSGYGKTHLAQAIGIDVKERFPDLVVLYVTGNEFKNQFIYAQTVKNNLTDFLAFYMRIDVLIVDDIQDLQGHATQNAFFNIFNHLHQNGKQLIFTSDRAPVDLQNFEERLASRFKWGLPVELQKPDFQTRLTMLRERRMREGLDISDEVLEYLAGKVTNNFRELESVMMSIVAHATLLHQEITLELAESLVGNLVSETVCEVTIDKVQDAVCEYFNITREQMLAKTRKRQIVQARQIAMFLCRNLISNCSLATIGMEIGGKDHATVLHSCTTVSDLMSTDKVFRKYVNDIQSMI